MSRQFSVDLTNCDREPIHIPGSIQPHGCLIACDAIADTVLRHSRNAGEMLGVDETINGKSLGDILGAEATHAVRNALNRTNDPSRPAVLFDTMLQNGRRFDIAVHRHDGACILEFEPKLSDPTKPLELARELIGRISSIESIDGIVKHVARLLQALLGYDRVMIYSFMHDGSGQVISEAKREGLESFLGQYFPASDIPQQARKLYLQNTIRVIADVNFEPVPVNPVFDAADKPLDLSFAHLRSVSPIHCEYLRNMGVAASMSISIIVDDELWGLIACHHYSPRILTMAQRIAAEMFGDFFSLRLSALKQTNMLEAATVARKSLDRFLRLAVRAQDIDGVIRDSIDDFARLIPCDGAGIWLNGNWTSQGYAPSEKHVPTIVEFAKKVSEAAVWDTNQISNDIAEALDYAADVSGVLIVPLSQRPRDYLFFFRREMVRTLNWAGNPQKTYATGPLGDRLTPRTSFDIWKQTVHRQSLPWTDEELEIAEATRTALAEVVLHHNELLVDERAKSDVRQRMLNQELNHRVKNILAVINSVIAQPSDDAQNVNYYISALRGRVQALATAHDQIIRGDGGGALTQLVRTELTPFRSLDTTFDVSGPDILLDARSFSVMALVLHELLTNAVKYGSLSTSAGTLRIHWKMDTSGNCIIDWKESGGPEARPPKRRGFGTVLVERSIPYDLGGESNVDYSPDGVSARLLIPARFVTLGKDTGAADFSEAVNPEDAEASDGDISAVRVLIVEDQMLIAMDIEQILRDAGASDFVTSATVSDAMEKIARFTPTVAVLDVNLGTETSEPVARELARLGIPFAFTTGYGETVAVVRQFPEAPVLQKPYDASSIVRTINRMTSQQNL